MHMRQAQLDWHCDCCLLQKVSTRLSGVHAKKTSAVPVQRTVWCHALCSLLAKHWGDFQGVNKGVKTWFDGFQQLRRWKVQRKKPSIPNYSKCSHVMWVMSNLNIC